MEFLNLLQKYPHLVCNHNLSSWMGFITVKDTNIHLSINCKCYPSVKNMQVSLSDDVLFSFAERHIKKAQAESSSLTEFLEKFTQYMEQIIGTHFEVDTKFGNADNLKRFSKMYTELLSEIESRIGYENVRYISSDFSDITLSTSDVNGKSHNLSLSLPNNYPAACPNITDIDIPAVCVASITQARTVSYMYRKFCDTISNLQEYWSLFSSLYSVCTIVDPKIPKCADSQCKIVLGSGVLLSVSFNPLDPRSCPELKLLGAERATRTFRQAIEVNCKEIGWEPDNDFYHNLLNILGLDEFPMYDSLHATTQLDDSDSDSKAKECSICFELQAEDDSIAVKLCPNLNCKGYFHESCLAKWLLAVPTNEPSFDIVTGKCPLCTETISCTVKTD